MKCRVYYCLCQRQIVIVLRQLYICTYDTFLQTFFVVLFHVPVYSPFPKIRNVTAHTLHYNGPLSGTTRVQGKSLIVP